MSDSLRRTYSGFEYSLVLPGDDLKEYVGYREGIEYDSAGQIINAGTYVVGSNNGWSLARTVGDASIYVRKAE